MTSATIDTATGLPEVPEGYFWRVGKFETSEYGYSGKKYTTTREGVVLIKQTVKVTHTERPVYGEKWYNAWKKVAVVIDKTTDVTESVHLYERFDETHVLFPGDELPEYARNPWTEITQVNENEERKTTKFRIAVTEAGVSFLAGRIFERFSAYEEDRINRERLFGDYPPKVLTGV